MKTSIKTTGHVQFRPTSTMTTQLEILANRWDVSINEIVRNMLALSLNKIDPKFYVFIQNMARANNNLNTFEECASHIGSFLKGRYGDVDIANCNEVNTSIIAESHTYVEKRS